MGQRLGQHFLQNTSVARKIAGATQSTAGEVVIEIGPGKKALTTPLRALCDEVHARYIGIERDEELAQNLTASGLEIVTGDALHALPEIVASLGGTPYVVVGNIPYYITGKLLRILSTLPRKPRQAILMIQKEVGERITSTPPAMNLLAGAVSFWAEPEILFAVGKENFSPPPKVDSVVIRLKTRDTPFPVSSEVYYPFLKSVFTQPRKLLLNNLEPLFENKNAARAFLEKQGVPEKTRGQDLSVTEIARLAKAFSTS